MQRIATACARCGVQLRSRFEAYTHCQKKPPPTPCSACGTLCSNVRLARAHCQQHGTSGGGYRWRFHESVERAIERHSAEIRADRQLMAEIRELARALVSRFIE